MSESLQRLPDSFGEAGTFAVRSSGTDLSFLLNRVGEQL
jgi:hypothetical protein